MSRLRADVDRGLEIREQMEKLTVELKGITARLTDAALHGEQVPLVDDEREGKQFLAQGTDKIVPVIITADNLMGEFPAVGDKFDTIVATLEDRATLLKFYKPVNKFENRFDNGKKFRALADELLGKAAPAFITACLSRDKFGVPKNAIKVVWDDATAKP